MNYFLISKRTLFDKVWSIPNTILMKTAQVSSLLISDCQIIIPVFTFEILQTFLPDKRCITKWKPT